MNLKKLFAFSATMIVAVNIANGYCKAGAGGWEDRFDWEYSDHYLGLGGFNIPGLALLSDFVCVGRIVSFPNRKTPEIEVLWTLYGPTNISRITPGTYPYLYKVPEASTNIFFALTNDWWNINMATTNRDVILRNRQMTYAWEVVTNHPLDNAVFTNWFLIDGDDGVVHLDTNDTEEVVQYVSNLVHIAKIAKDKRQFFDFVGGYETNAPARLKLNIKKYYKDRFFGPSKPRDLLRTLLPYIDYDMLWKGLEGPDE